MTPLGLVTSDMLKRIPVSLRSFTHSAIRRVYLAPPANEDSDSGREVDYLWSRLEQMHNSLEESKSSVTAAEDKLATMSETLRQEQEKYRQLQKIVALLQQQRRPMQVQQSSDNYGSPGPSNSRATFQTLDEQIPEPVVQMNPAGIQPSARGEFALSSSCVPQTHVFGLNPAPYFPVTAQPMPGVPYAYSQSTAPISMLSPMSLPSSSGSPPPSTMLSLPSHQMHTRDPRLRPLIGPARDKQMADIRYMRTHATLLQQRRAFAATHTQSYPNFDSPHAQQQPDEDAWM